MRTVQDNPAFRLNASEAETFQNLNIFLSYRRDDASAYALLLFQSLSERYGHNVFMDIDSLAPGMDFVDAINDTLRRCDVVLVLIGRGWLAASDGAGKHRLENPEDFVRVEVETSLSRNIRVVPVLVGGTVMPRGDQLPGELAKLARRHAFELSDTRWHKDVEALITALELNPAPAPPPLPAPPALSANDHPATPSAREETAQVSTTPAHAVANEGGPLGDVERLAAADSGRSDGAGSNTPGLTTHETEYKQLQRSGTRRRWIVIGVLAVAVLAAVVAVVIIVGSSHQRQSTPPVMTHDSLASGKSLSSGQSLRSPNGLYTLTMNANGELAEYMVSNRGKEKVWTSETADPNSFAEMEGDGDFKVFQEGAKDHCCWLGGTITEDQGATLRLENSGRFAVVTASGVVIWQSGINDWTLVNGTKTLGRPQLSSVCTITVSFSNMADMFAEPSYGIGSGTPIPDGKYPTLANRPVNWAGQVTRWYEITVHGRTGWIPDDGIQITAKSHACPIS
jgi:hypothetical protein